METIKYREHTINIETDDCAGNPFTNSDCHPPTYIHGYRQETEHGLDLDVPELTNVQIRVRAGEIARELGFKTLLAATTRHASYCRGQYTDGVELVNEAIGNYADELETGDRMEFVRQCYEWKGIQAICVTRNGYSQGDWLDFLVVATPKWCKEVGASPDCNLEYTVDEYAAFAFGDVYGFTVEETEDSCWGFYGNDHDKSGLMEHAKDSIDCTIESNLQSKRAGNIMTLASYGGTA